jgi:hypothetical protein
MTFDDTYNGEVKVTIIATWFPVITQDQILNIGWARNSRFASKKWWQDFVNRSLDNTTKNNFQTKPVEVKDDIDYETPAFLRKKLLNG